ncbi:MAG: Hsp20/alpha crystallin family protein [Chloroflexota bacterium]
MDKNQTMEVQKEEVTTPEGTERTRECACFVPRADVYEVDDQIVIVADVPGANENSVDITLEKNILTINAYVEVDEKPGYALTYAEYEVGDYQRSFKLSDEIDSERIEATIREGVLRVYLPKSTEARTRKINVKAS